MHFLLVVSCSLLTRKDTFHVINVGLIRSRAHALAPLGIQVPLSRVNYFVYFVLLYVSSLTYRWHVVFKKPGLECSFIGGN